MNVLKMKDFSFAYNDEKVTLNKLNLEIKTNQITAVIGGNGVGKSTFLLGLNGINKPQSGQLYYEDILVKYDKKSLINLRKNVGVLFQNPDDQLFLDDPIKDISFGLKNLNYDDSLINERIKEIVKQLQLEDFINQPIHTMSFGQKKKIALAGILVMKPQVIILDEPTAGLDPNGIDNLFKIIDNLTKNDKLTIILSTHDIDLVAKYTDNVLVLNKGYLVYQGLTSELFKEPEILLENNLKLPSITYLLKHLNDEYNLNVDTCASTINQAALSINNIVRGTNHE